MSFEIGRNSQIKRNAKNVFEKGFMFLIFNGFIFVFLLLVDKKSTFIIQMVYISTEVVFLC